MALKNIFAGSSADSVQHNITNNNEKNSSSEKTELGTVVKQHNCYGSISHS